jgi:hypothetical protein
MRGFTGAAGRLARELPIRRGDDRDSPAGSENMRTSAANASIHVDAFGILAPHEALAKTLADSKN